MNPGNQTNSANAQPAAAAVSLDDIYFTLFRHKWMILGFICLGLVAAVAVRFLRPPPFVSKAKLMVLYVKDIRPSITSSNQDEQIMPVDLGPVVNSEMEIIKSRDVAEMVVDEVGPQRILATLGGGTNRNKAIGVVASGIDVEVPIGTAILTVSFKHRDPDLVQPLLNVLLKAYQFQHIEVREKVKQRDEYYAAERDKLNAEISNIDQQLKQLKSKGQVIFLDEVKRDYQTRILQAKDDLMTAKRDLEERRLILGSAPNVVTSSNTATLNEPAVPADTLNNYTDVVADLEANHRRERELKRDGYLEAHPVLLRVEERIAKLQKEQSELEKRFPALKQLAFATKTSSTNGAEVAGVDDLKVLIAKVKAREQTLNELNAEAAPVLDLEPKLVELERKHDEAQRKYEAVVNQLSSAGSDTRAAGPPVNMSMVQSPTPPAKDLKKFYKLVGIVFGGCAGMGFALAFAFDMVIDRTIRRSRDIEKHLRLPVFLAIPHSSWTASFRWPWSPNRRPALGPTENATSGDSSAQSNTALAHWTPDHHLKAYTEGLRERLITYFEIHNLNLKKPKLVAVTGCTSGSGVTTLASGLAAELSKTGEGNVLYVDMNGGQGAAHPFYQGKPGPGLAEVLEPEGKTGAQVEEKLYLACLDDGNKGKTKQEPRTGFSQLVPKLKASDYDYIIFDMPW